jgi:hypothetical protein
MDALKGFGAIPAAEADEFPTTNGDPDFIPDLETMEELFEKYAPLVEKLRESNRRTEFKPGIDYESGLRAEGPALPAVLLTARILSDRAVHFHDSGRRSEGLDSVILGISVGHDTARGGAIVQYLVQLVCEGILQESIRELLARHEFKAAELAEFAARLERLWETRPEFGPTLDAEQTELERSYSFWGLEGGGSGALVQNPNGPAIGTSWRYVYSRRLVCAGALTEWDRQYSELRSLLSKAPHERIRAAAEVGGRWESSRNPLVQLIQLRPDRLFLRDAVSRMQWTLLRVSVALARFEIEKGRPPLQLSELVPQYLSSIPACPLTGLPLGYQSGRVWSPGRNGVDDGGVPGKDDDPDAADGDVVWVVKRRK